MVVVTWRYLPNTADSSPFILSLFYRYGESAVNHNETTMTPKGIIFAEMGLPIPRQNDIREWLFVDDLSQHSAIRMTGVLREENRNLREGLQTMQLANDELVEANNYQQEHILRLTRENGRLEQRAAKYMAELKANSAIYTALLNAHIEAMERIEELEGERP